MVGKVISACRRLQHRDGVKRSRTVTTPYWVTLRDDLLLEFFGDFANNVSFHINSSFSSLHSARR
jgi:hypothetical protein